MARSIWKGSIAFGLVNIPVELHTAVRDTNVDLITAMLEALEKEHEMPGAHGIFTMSPTDHLGLDQRAVVMVTIDWSLDDATTVPIVSVA